MQHLFFSPSKHCNSHFLIIVLMIFRQARPATAAAAVLSSASAKEPSASSPSGPSRLQVSSAPLEPTDRWLVVKKGGARRGAANAEATAGPSALHDNVASLTAAADSGGPISLRPFGVGPVIGPLCDPWADEQLSAGRARPGAGAEPAAEDWEAALRQLEDVRLGGGRMGGVLDGLPEDHNQWQALEEGDGESEQVDGVDQEP